MQTSYPLARSIRLRLVGSALLFAGFLVLVAALVVEVAELDRAILNAVVVLAALGVLVANVSLSRLRPVLALDDHGYRIRYVRGVGESTARWLDVTDVGTASVRGVDVLVFNLRSGSASRLPVGVVQAAPDDVVRAVQAHLQRGHGYKSISKGRR